MTPNQIKRIRNLKLKVTAKCREIEDKYKETIKPFRRAATKAKNKERTKLTRLRTRIANEIKETKTLEASRLANEPHIIATDGYIWVPQGDYMGGGPSRGGKFHLIRDDLDSEYIESSDLPPDGPQHHTAGHRRKWYASDGYLSVPISTACKLCAKEVKKLTSKAE